MDQQEKKLRAFKRNLKYHEFSQTMKGLKQQSEQQQMMIEQMKNGLIGGGNLYGMGENGRRNRQREDEIDEELRAIREEKMMMKKMRRELAEKEVDDELYKKSMNEMMDMQKQLMNAIISNENEAFKLKNNPVVPQVIMMPGVEGYTKFEDNENSRGIRRKRKSKPKAKPKKKKKKKKKKEESEDDEKAEEPVEEEVKELEVEEMPAMLVVKPKKPKKEPKEKKGKKSKKKEPIIIDEPEEEPEPEPEPEPEEEQETEPVETEPKPTQTDMPTDPHTIEDIAVAQPFNPEDESIEFILFAGQLFPDNSHISKVFISIIDSEDNIISSQEHMCVADPSSSIYNPNYSFLVSFTKEEIITNPYAFVHFIVVVIDDVIDFENLGENVYNTSILGVGLINLFLDKKTKEMPDENTKKILINSGLFHVPLYYPEVTSLPVSQLYRRIKEEIEVKRIIPSTLLVSINKYESGQDLPELEPFQPGDEQVFDSSYVTRTPNEDRVMELFKSRPPVLMRDLALDLLMAKNEKKFNAHAPPEEQDAQIKEHFNQVLQLNSATKLVETLGFYKIKNPTSIVFSLDSVFLFDLAKPVFCSFLVSFDNKINFSDAKLISKINLSSPVSLMEFEESEVEIPWEELQNADKIILVIFKADYQDDLLDIDQIGFTILPLKTEDGVIHGTFQLPIFNEPLDKDSFDFIGSKDPWTVLDKLTRRVGDRQPRIVTTSLIVRFFPGEIEDMYTKKNDTTDVNSMFLPVSFPDEFIFTKEKVDEFKRSTRVRSVLPKDFDVVEVEQSIVLYFRQVSGDGTIDIEGVPEINGPGGGGDQAEDNNDDDDDDDDNDDDDDDDDEDDDDDDN